jgi:hypothetical protein
MDNFTEADGRQLAVDMIRELDHFKINEDSLWLWSINAKYRPEDTPQDNVLLRYLDNIQQRGSRDLLMGFCAVITDYFGCAGSAGVPDEAFYETLSERDITGKPAPWPTMEEDDEASDSKG